MGAWRAGRRARVWGGVGGASVHAYVHLKPTPFLFTSSHSHSRLLACTNKRSNVTQLRKQAGRQASKRACARMLARVQVMNEGPGHVPLNKIPENMAKQLDW